MVLLRNDPSLREPVLFGRGALLRQLNAGLRDAAAGRARTLVLRGTAGVGKTAVLDAFTAEAESVARVLPLSGHPAESQLPYAGVHQLMHAAREPTDPRSDGVDPLRDAANVLRVLTRLADERPIVVIVDDAHWLDSASRRALVFAARRLEAERALLVFALRTDEADDLGVGETVDVPPLSAEESVQLLAELHPDLSARVAARISSQSSGLPLALAEIPADLTVAQRTGAQPLPEVMPLGPTLIGLFEKRINALSDAARLAMLAVSFEPLDAAGQRSALSALGVSIEDLEDAERLGLVRVVDSRCVFRHPSVPAAMQNLARARELTQVHRALTAVFALDPLRAAAHLLQDTSAPAEHILPVVIAGAREAAQLRSHTEAAQLWSAASTIAARMHSPRQERQLLREALNAHLRAGAAPEARVIIERLLPDSSETAERAELLRGLVAISTWTTSTLPPSSDMLEAEAGRLREHDAPDVRHSGGELMSALVMAALTNGHYPTAHRIASRLTSSTGEPGTDGLEHRLLQDLTAVMVGADGAGSVLRSRWTDSYPWERIIDPASPVGFLAVSLDWLGEYDLLESALEGCRAAIDEYGPATSALFVRGSISVNLDRHRGQWDRALSGYEGLDQLAYDSDFTAPTPFFALRQAHLLAARGDALACEDARRRARDRAPVWTSQMEHLDRCVAGLLALALRDYPTATAALADAARIERASGVVVSAYLSRMPDAFEAAWRQGQEQSLLSELDRFDDAMAAIGHTELRALAERCRALIAPAAEMDERFERAVEGLITAQDGFEAARTRLLWGERLRRARRRAHAREQLTLAQETFHRLGAHAWSAQCDSELAACGVRRAAVVETADAAATLTPRELDVAREVAAGASNAAAARRLFISERTVEYHLQNIFRKLELHSRQELRDALNG